MNQKEAHQLAEHIENEFDGVWVLAVGRFLDPSEITDRSPWKISVVVVGQERPRVIDSAKQLSTLRFKPAPERKELVAEGMLF